MAEVFGIVAGAGGLATAFVPCLECFEFIQLGRHFGKDYQACQLKLDVIALRLSRWGFAIGLGEPPNSNGSPTQPKITATEHELRIMEDILEAIFEDLKESKERSDRFKARMDRGNDGSSKNSSVEIYDPGTELQGGFRLLHGTTTGIVARRQKQEDGSVGFWKKTKWALYEKKVFDRLIQDITNNMDQLESVFPAVKEALQETSRAELKTIDNKEDLKLLATVAGESDEVLVGAVEKRLATKGDTWTRFDIAPEKSGRVHVGSGFGAGVKPTTDSTFDTFKIGGQGFTQVGHNFQS